MQQAATRRNGAVALRAPPIFEAAACSSGSSGAGATANGVLPAVAPLTPPLGQAYVPLPVNSLMQMVDSLPAAAAPGSGESDAMLRAMHDYMSHALPDTFHSDHLATFSTDASGLSHLVLPMPAMPAFAASPPLAPAAGATGAVPRATAAAMLNASQRMATALQKLQPALGGQLPRNGCAAPAAACPDDADGFAKCWAQHLSQIQSLLAEGLPEADATFVSKLASELLASQSADGPLPAPPPPPPPLFAAGAPPPVPPPAATDAYASDAPPSAAPPGGEQVARALDKAHGDLGGDVAASPPPPPAKRAPFVTDKVLPFIERPYKLLQDLHASAERSVSSSERTHCDTSTEAEASPHLDALRAAAASKAESDDAEEGGEEGAEGGAWAELAARGDESGAATDAKSPASVELSEDATAPADGGAAAAPGGAEGRCAAPEGGKPPLQGGAGWRSVLQRLVTAGPQAMPPGSPFRPGSSGGWASTQSSTEPDTVSFRSEDVFGVDGAAAAAAARPAAPAASAKQAKKKRAKKAKGHR